MLFTFIDISLFPGKKSSELDGQLHTSSIQLPQLEIQDMQTSLPEAAPGDLKFVQEQFQDFNGKVKLQLFPIDEATRKALEKVNLRSLRHMISGDFTGNKESLLFIVIFSFNLSCHMTICFVAL